MNLAKAMRCAVANSGGGACNASAATINEFGAGARRAGSQSCNTAPLDVSSRDYPAGLVPAGDLRGWRS